MRPLSFALHFLCICLCAGLYAIFCTLPMNAQERYAKHFDTDNGLSSSFVYHILQDDNGYIWMATNEGLCRYDGQRFLAYDEHTGFKERSALRILKDHTGKLWFLVRGKIYFYAQNTFTLFSHPSLPTSMRYLWMTEDHSGNLWLSCRSGLLYRIKPDNTIDSVLIEKGQYIAYMECMPDNRLCLGTRVGCFLVTQSLHVRKIPTLQSKGVYVRAYNLKDGRTLVANSEGLFELRDTIAHQIFAFDKSFPSSNITSLLEDKDGDIWIALEYGVYLCRKGVFDLHKAEKVLSDILPSFILQDIENNYWISTMDKGIYCIYNKNVLCYTTRQGLASNYIENILSVGNNDIIVQHYNGCFDEIKKGKIKKLPYQLNGSAYFSQLPDGRYYYINGDSTHIINRFYVDSRKTKQYIKYFKSSSGVWYYQDNNGVYQYNPSGKHSLIHSFAKYSSQEIRENIAYRTWDIVVEDNARIWFATSGGIYRLEGDTILHLQTLHPACTTFTKKLYQDSLGNIWACTAGSGLLCFHGSSVYNITMDHGLPSNVCRTICLDSNNTLWVCTAAGISKIHWKDSLHYSIRNLGMNDGLGSNEILDIQKIGSTIWLASGTGGVIAFPDTLSLQSNPSLKVNIQEIMAEGRKLPLSSQYDFDNDVNTLSFEFIGISYRSNGNIHYKYRLIGSDDTAWVYTSQSRIHFSALSPGDYTFQVMAQNKDGVWGEKPAQVQFNIKAPVWQRSWFLLGTVGVLAVGIGVVLNWRKRLRERQNSLRRQLVDAELQALRLQINPHFIFNSLNSIQEFMLEHQPKEANRYLSKFANLMRMIINYSRMSSITIAEEITFLATYIELEQLRFEHHFDYSIVVDEEIEQHRFVLPPILLQPIVENAIKHGFTNTPKQGKLRIHFGIKNNQLVCTIEDNGKGRNGSHNSSDTVIQGTATGIRNTSERLEILAKLWKENNEQRGEIIFTDLYSSEGTPQGTKVEVWIPNAT